MGLRGVCSSVQWVTVSVLLIFQVGCSKVPASWFANIRGEQASESSGPGPTDLPPTLKLTSHSSSSLTPLFEVTSLKDGDQVILFRGADANCNPGTVVGQAVARTGALSPPIKSINKSGSGVAASFRARVERASGEVLCTEPVSVTLPSATLGVYAPYYIPTLTDVASVAAGNTAKCALLGSGTVWCWGTNSNGGLGNGSPSSQTTETPVQVSGLTGVTQISSWSYFGFLALTQAGKLYWWGTSPDLGVVSSTPTLIGLFPDVIQLNQGLLLYVSGEVRSADSLTSSGPALATEVTQLKSSFAGEYFMRFQGTSTLEAPVYDPVAGRFTGQYTTLSNLGTVIDAALGDEHACYLSESSPQSSQVHCYGTNDWGQLGVGSVQSSAAPLPVAIQGGKRLFAGLYSTYALQENGEVLFWGKNGSQAFIAPASLSWLTNVQELDAQTFHHACAAQSTGTVICWNALDFSVSGP